MSNEYYSDEYELEDEIALAPSTPAGKSGTLTPRGRTTAIILGTLAIVLAVVYIAWSVWSVPTIRGKDVGFKIVSSEVTELTFDIAKPEDLTVTCTLNALNQSYAQVGTRDVVIGPANKFEQRFTVEIRTTELPVSATVERCFADKE